MTDWTFTPPTDLGTQEMAGDWDVSQTTELVVEEEGAFKVLAFGAALFAFALLGYVIAWSQ